MLQSLAQYIEQRLATEGAANVKPARFAELAGRLLASGVVWREHSRPEAALYDDAIQCEQLLREWFACIGFVLVHDSDARLLRERQYGKNLAQLLSFSQRAHDGDMQQYVLPARILPQTPGDDHGKE